MSLVSEPAVFSVADSHKNKVHQAHAAAVEGATKVSAKPSPIT